jgi:hypothetical protein
VQVVQAVDQVDQIVTLICSSVVERVGGNMQEFVRQAVSQGFDDLFRVLTLG